jgi:hypothetical protein
LISQLNSEQKLETHTSDLPFVSRTFLTIARQCFASIEVEDDEVNA